MKKSHMMLSGILATTISGAATYTYIVHDQKIRELQSYDVNGDGIQDEIIKEQPLTLDSDERICYIDGRDIFIDKEGNKAYHWRTTPKTFLIDIPPARDGVYERHFSVGDQNNNGFLDVTIVEADKEHTRLSSKTYDSNIVIQKRKTH